MLTLTRCINEHLVKDGNIHYGIITQMVKNEMIQWIYIPTKNPGIVVLLTEDDLEIINKKIEELNNRDGLPMKKEVKDAKISKG
jgi:hypothetical protein